MSDRQKVGDMATPQGNQIKVYIHYKGLVVMQREITNVNYALPNHYLIVNTVFSCRTNCRLSLV